MRVKLIVTAAQMATAARSCRVTPRAARALGATASLTALLAAAATPAAAATLKDGYPFAPGDTFTYKFSSTNAVQSGCTGKPTVAKLAYTETTTILPEITYSYPPDKSAQVYPFHTTATASTSLGPLTVNNTDYRNFIKHGKDTDLVDYGFVYVSDTVETSFTNHVSTTRSYLTPLTRDQQPRVKNAKLALPITFNEIIDHHDVTSTGNSNVLQSNATRKANGAYTESGMTFDVPYSITQNEDSTGIGIEGPSNAPETWNFSLPEAGASGDVIPVLATYAGKSGTNLVPDWYPGHAKPPSPLASSHYIDKGTVKVPAGCGAYAGKPATLVQMTYIDLASVNGYTYDETDSFYVINKIGRACIEVTQVRKTYDQEVTGQCQTSVTFKSKEGLVSESLK